VRKFGNTANKVRAILEVIEPGEMVDGRTIARRLAERGYRVNEGHIKMFIYYHMLYRYLRKVKINGVNHYSLIS
jgi:repressor of nif and glnA expression